MERDFKKKDFTIWMDQPKSYNWLDKKYYQNREKTHKPPKWFWKIGKLLSQAVHDIDYDVSGDETIEKWYREKMQKKVIALFID